MSGLSDATSVARWLHCGICRHLPDLIVIRQRHFINDRPSSPICRAVEAPAAERSSSNSCRAPSPSVALHPSPDLRHQPCMLTSPVVAAAPAKLFVRPCRFRSLALPPGFQALFFPFVPCKSRRPPPRTKYTGRPHLATGSVVVGGSADTAAASNFGPPEPGSRYRDTRR